MVSVTDILLIALIAGVGGTGIGGAIGSLFKNGSDRMISLLLSLTGGVMVAIVCFELLAESAQAAKMLAGGIGVLIAAGSVLFGVFAVYALNAIIDRVTAPQVPHTADADHPALHDDIDEFVHVDHYVEHAKTGAAKRDLWLAGVIIACVIALHNVPEGMSIGATYAIDSDGSTASAIMLAILIGLHNIPEGMAVTVPLVAGGTGRLKATLMTAATGIPMVIGAGIGLWVGEMGPIGLSCSLGFASGAMLYVVFGEILPQVILLYRSRIPAITVVVGILIGMCLIYL